MAKNLLAALLTTTQPRVFSGRKRLFSSVNESYNPLNIQQLPEEWRKRLGFYSERDDQVTMVQLSRHHLNLHKLAWDKKPDPLKIPTIPQVPLLGKNLSEHFYRLGLLSQEGYEAIASTMAIMPLTPIPTKFSQKAGWTAYDTLNGQVEHEAQKRIEEEEGLVLDVEACLNDSPFPLFAVALGASGHWYSWTSPAVVSDSPHQLIPLRSNKQLVIGHNVSFDRIRLKDEYQLELGHRRFLDTLSLHCAVSGLSSQQRGLWKESKKKEAASLVVDLESEAAVDRNGNKEIAEWVKHSAMNNLADAYALHCGKKLDKSTRDLLIKGDVSTVREHFDEIAGYCARDVQATAELFQRLLPAFREKCPHPVTFGAILQMGSFILPVNPDRWDKYVQRCERKHLETINNLEAKLIELCYEKANLSLEQQQADPWISKLDCALIPAQFCKPKKLPDGTMYSNPKGNERLFGKPLWFKQLWHKEGPKVTIRTQIVPYLLGIKWDGHPVHYQESMGWCYTAADGSVKRVPHPEEEGANVGCLLSKSFFKSVDSGRMTAESPILKELMAAMQAFSMWIGYRERIQEQLVIVGETPESGFIIPGTITMGTVTRRAVEKTWMTAANAKAKIAGSELKSLVEAPSGWRIVGADVDSQELWIASLFGDAQFGLHGGTAVGWMTLQGKRADGTDLHSRTAAILGMNRDNAKIFTYGRIYGAGQKYATQLLARFNPTLPIEEAEKKAEELYVATKGKKSTVKKFKYFGGTESFMFNSLESVALSEDTLTPILRARISDALGVEQVRNQFMTSRVNWVVQSSAVDYLHLLLVSMQHLMTKYGIRGRLMLTIHDEIRYLVREEDAYWLALALQISNLWVRSFFAQRLLMDNLPLSVAFFSAIDVDHVMRKDPTSQCLTVTNSEPIQPGQALDIYQLLELQADFLSKGDASYSTKEEKALKVQVPKFSATDFVTGRNEKRILQQINPQLKNLPVEEEKGLNAPTVEPPKKRTSLKSLAEGITSNNKK